MTKVISFLGNSPYKETTYVYQGQQYSTRFFPAAAAFFVHPDELYVCVTPTVKVHANLSDLGAELDAQGISWAPLDIPEGRSEAELWQIFDEITMAVDEGETVVFDVTHSFRSLPMLVFLAVAFLKAAKSVQVERVFYGAFDARDQQTNLSPVFDLTPFASLLDWLTATSRFVESGDGVALAALLRAGMPSAVLMKEDLASRSLGKNLRLAAESIESISLALRLARPIETMQSAAQLESTLNRSMPGIQQRAKPFALLVNSLVQEYGQFALEDTDDDENLREGLRLQLKLIDWYIRRRQIVQAATLAREWVVSLLALDFGAPMFQYKRGREQLEWALNNAVELKKPYPRPIAHVSDYDARLASHPKLGDLIRIWNQMSAIRNDIAHVGMRIAPEPASLLKQKMEQLNIELAQIGAFFLDAQPEEDGPS